MKNFQHKQRENLIGFDKPGGKRFISEHADICKKGVQDTADRENNKHHELSKDHISKDGKVTDIDELGCVLYFTNSVTDCPEKD